VMERSIFCLLLCCLTDDSFGVSIYKPLRLSSISASISLTLFVIISTCLILLLCRIH
ncbi:hypothetical protein L9F63_012130, partial [Diploptera punctata]